MSFCRKTCQKTREGEVICVCVDKKLELQGKSVHEEEEEGEEGEEGVVTAVAAAVTVSPVADGALRCRFDRLFL